MSLSLASSPRRVNTPITIFGSKLMSWLRGDLGVTFSSGSLVQTWADQSGNGRDFYQGTPANQPTQTTLGGGQLAIHFDRTWPATLALTGTSYGSPSAAQVIRVMIRNADPPAVSAASGLDDFGTHAAKSHVPFTDGIIYDSTACGSGRATVGNPGPSMATLCVYESISTGSKFEALLDGTSLYSGASLACAIAATPVIGGMSGGAYMDGEIAEHIVLNAEASAGERTAWAAYVLARYGLTII